MSRLARALLLIAGALLLTVLVVRVGVTTIAALVLRVGWTIAAVAVVYAAHVGVRAAALWRCLIPASIGFKDVLRIRFAGEAVEMLTFTGPFLAEPTKGWLLSRSGAAVADAFGAVVVEYLLYTLTASWMAAAAFALLLRRNALPHPLATAVAILLAIIAAFTIAFAAARWRRRGLLACTLELIAPVAGERAKRLAERIEPVEAVILSFVRDHPARLVEVLLVEACGHGLLALEVALVMSALGLPFGALDPVIVEGGVKFISIAFFFVPGQLGAQESVYTLLFQALGYPAAAGLTLALVRRVRAFAVAGAGTVALSLTS